MRAAVGDAISTTRTSRLPRLLFAGAKAEGQRVQESAATPASRFYWLFVPSPHGYAVAEHRAAAALARGYMVECDGVSYRVSVVARSPFLDGRLCAYLELP